MNLHNNKSFFEKLILRTSKYKNLSESSIRRDYYIVLMLENLSKSEYSESCVFKGGTSLSKCYPGTIERFSEDIDLTFLGMELNDNLCDKKLKKIESVIT